MKSEQALIKQQAKNIEILTKLEQKYPIKRGNGLVSYPEYVIAESKKKREYYATFSMTKLRHMCSVEGVKGRSVMSKEQLIEALIEKYLEYDAKVKYNALEVGLKAMEGK